jgi:hypothetical protein
MSQTPLLEMWPAGEKDDAAVLRRSLDDVAFHKSGLSVRSLPWLFYMLRACAIWHPAPVSSR